MDIITSEGEKRKKREKFGDLDGRREKGKHMAPRIIENLNHFQLFKYNL